MKGGNHTFIHFDFPKKDKENDCYGIVVETELVKVQAEVLRCKKGDILALIYEENTLKVKNGSTLCGYITPPEFGRIVECMRKGFYFKAAIIELRDKPLYCKVIVRILEK
ncbi:MAG: hypothetical protein LKI39_01000 [Bacteroides sp.]|jgi:hypothetical protein|nr:hypothetical protein [Bacteroides sp.]MCI1681116.1 hypothetical protein [Bacteroides sp.]